MAHSTAIRDICERIALRNGGLLYLVGNWGHRDEIQAAYRDSPKTGGMVRTGKVSHEEIQENLLELAENGPFEHIRDEEVFFLDPFKSTATDGPTQIYNTLSSIFENKPYVSEMEFQDLLSTVGIEVAPDDTSEYVGRLEARGLIESVGSLPTAQYYTAGQKLYEESTALSDIESGLEEEVNEKGQDGYLTYSQLRSYLDQSISDEIERNLVDTKEAVIKLDDKYLINTKECRKKYLSYLVEQLETDIEGEFETNHYAMTKPQLESIIQSELRRKSIYTQLRNPEKFVDTGVKQIESEFEFNKLTKLNEFENQVKVYEYEDEFEDAIEAEAETIFLNVQDELANNSIGTFDYIRKNRIKPKLEPTYSSEPVINEHIRDKIVEEVSKKISSASEIPISE